MPTSEQRAAAALRRDLRLAAAQKRVVARQFRREADAVLAAVAAGADPAEGVAGPLWADTLGAVWTTAGAEAFTPALEELAPGAKSRVEANKQLQRLVALVVDIIGSGRPAERIAGFIEDAANGVVTTTRRRIQTVLRGLERPSEVREVSRALRRLYLTDFVDDRAGRIALDSVLRSTATFEHAAALVAADATGWAYEQIWVSQGDGRVRATHSEAHGQAVALDEAFKVGGALLRYPRDPAGPPGETYGCRCWTERRRVQL